MVCAKIHYRRVIYSNGDLYEGGVKQGLRHGKGVYRTKEGDVYEGGYWMGKRYDVYTHTLQQR